MIFIDTWSGAGFLVPHYAFMYALAIVLGTYLAVREAELRGLDAFAVFKACLIVMAAAIVGARLFVAAQYWGYYRQHPSAIPNIWNGGTASSGAFIAGIFAAVVSALWYRLPTARFFDCCAPSAALAIGLGRIGCFLNGCCYGSRSDLPWAVSFPAEAGPYHDHLASGLISAGNSSLPVHPTQLYEALFIFAVYILLMRIRSLQKSDGIAAATLFLAYPAFRFLNEFIRGDERGTISIFSVPQVLALVLMTVSIGFLLISFLRKRGGRFTNAGIAVERSF